MAHAVRVDEMLNDPALEARARNISEELRCLVCQNESIDESDAPLAHDLRVLIRQRVLAGDTDEQAKQYVVTRYGDYVLLKPPLKPSTLPLWFGPFLLFMAAMGGAAMFYQRRASPEPPISDLEERKLSLLIDEKQDPPEKVGPDL
jgi:cytochrome c-type biogenesis protein CcmH